MTADTTDLSVSIVIPCHGQAAAGYLHDAVRSARSQSLAPREVILVADGCNTCREAMLRVQASWIAPGIDLLLTDTDPDWVLSTKPPQSDQPWGIAQARNLGLAFATSRYAVCLDSDDMLEPTYLGRCLATVDPSAEYSIVTTHYRAFGDSDEQWKSSWEPASLKYSNSLHVSSMFSRALWEAVGGYDPAGMGWEDWSFWIACSKLHPKVSVVGEELFRYRVHGAQISKWIDQNRAAVRASVLLSHPDLYPEDVLRSAEKDLRDCSLEFATDVGRRWALFPDSPTVQRIATLAGWGCSVCGDNHGRCEKCGLPLGSIQHAPMPCRCGAWSPALPVEGEKT